MDANGDQVGKVRDVVVQMRTPGRAPLVRGLVVELFARRRIFVPMVRVHAIDAVQIMISGTVNTQVFSAASPRPSSSRTSSTVPSPAMASRCG